MSSLTNDDVHEMQIKFAKYTEDCKRIISIDKNCRILVTEKQSETRLLEFSYEAKPSEDIFLGGLEVRSQTEASDIIVSYSGGRAHIWSCTY